MKLLTKTSLLIITGSIFIFWTGNLVFFHLTREMINRHINSELMTQMAGVMTGLNSGGELDDLRGSFDDIDIVHPNSQVPAPPSFRDTVLYNSSRQEFVAHRALRFPYRSADELKDIIIYKSLLSADSLIERITLLSVAMLIVFIIMIFILNRYIFTNVWSGFSDSLKRLDLYDLNKHDSLSLPGSEIEEFNKLNHVLLEMADRIQSDYRSLKELTANTSHEIQTPLAIIRNKAELLLQSESLSEKDMDTVGSILATCGRLSKLNQSLLLIARIENNQFDESEICNLKESIEEYTSNLEVLINAGDFTLALSLESCLIRINPTLLGVLMTNLLKNAITHGERKSEIGLLLRDCVLEVTNPGKPLPFPDDQLFSRFIGSRTKEGSTGIGLEIVRKICSYYNIEVDHRYTEGIHTFRVDFSRLKTKE